MNLIVSCIPQAWIPFQDPIVDINNKNELLQLFVS